MNEFDTPEHRSRRVRGILVYSISIVFFLIVFGLLIHAIQPLLLPIILGVFLGYVFRPVVQFRGSPFKKLLRASVLIATVVLFGYFTFNVIRESLPSETEKLELMVRLQYKLNERYREWMGLSGVSSGTTQEEGNFFYKQFGAELDPLIQKLNGMLLIKDSQIEELEDHYEEVAAMAGEEAVEKQSRYLASVKAAAQMNEKDKKKQLREIAKAEKNNKTTEGTGSAAVVNSEDQKSPRGLTALLKIISVWLVFPLTFMFVMLDKGQILHFIIRVCPNRYFELSMNIVDHVDAALGKYIRGTALECLLVGITLAIGFWICGFPWKAATAIGFIGGLTNAIPFVGTFIASAIGAVYSLITEDLSPLLPFITDSNVMLAVIGVVVIAHLLDNAVFQPMVLGSAVNLHPLVVIIGVFGGSIAFGFAGLVLAIPTIVVFKVVTETLFRGLKAYRII